MCQSHSDLTGRLSLKISRRDLDAMKDVGSDLGFINQDELKIGRELICVKFICPHVVFKCHHNSDVILFLASSVNACLDALHGPTIGPLNVGESIRQLNIPLAELVLVIG